MSDDSRLDDAERNTADVLPPFRRGFFDSDELASRIGNGSYGGKAQGLIDASGIIATHIDPDRYPSIEVSIPRMVVLTTEVFEAYMTEGDLYEIALSDAPDDHIGHAFQRANLPTEYLGDLRSLIEENRNPLAIRSSSLLEDRLFEPFAGVYGTKMIPNNDPDPNLRFRRLMEAIKFVYASTFSRGAKDYARGTNVNPNDERMAVIIQEIIGQKHDTRFYPELSGVARSYNSYPFGHAQREDGVVSLALGLGKSIVDGETVWSYSLEYPRSPPPFASVSDQMRRTQLDFWCVNLGTAPEFDPIKEAEYLIRTGRQDADYDGSLTHIASTLDRDSDSLRPGTANKGPRVLDFAPLLINNVYPLNDLLKELLAACREFTGQAVEIEFAMTFPRPGQVRLGFLQTRPMFVSQEQVTLSDEDYNSPRALVAATPVMGNGANRSLRDIIYVKPGAFDMAHSRVIASEVAAFNQELVSSSRHYLLIGFGRWGSSEEWLGIPVDWGQISGARAIVEGTLPSHPIEPSQGSHFFHNIASFGVVYFHEGLSTESKLDWEWLSQQETVAESKFVRHVRTESPLQVLVDGQSGRGVILRPE